MKAENMGELLAMFRLLEVAKQAVQEFERGEVNVREAVRLIWEATAGLRAA